MPERTAEDSLAMAGQDDHSAPPRRSWMRWSVYAAVALACALVFVLYVRPDMMVTLADQLWACF